MNSLIGRVHLAEENNKAPGRPQMWSPGPALFYGSWTLRDYAAGTPEGDLDPTDSALWGGDILRKEMVPRRTPKRGPLGERGSRPPRRPPFYGNKVRSECRAIATWARWAGISGGRGPATPSPLVGKPGTWGTRLS